MGVRRWSCLGVLWLAACGEPSVARPTLAGFPAGWNIESGAWAMDGEALVGRVDRTHEANGQPVWAAVSSRATLPVTWRLTCRLTLLEGHVVELAPDLGDGRYVRLYLFARGPHATDDPAAAGDEVVLGKGRWHAAENDWGGGTSLASAHLPVEAGRTYLVHAVRTAGRLEVLVDGEPRVTLDDPGDLPPGGGRLGLLTDGAMRVAGLEIASP
jgi:hypothetical protein